MGEKLIISPADWAAVQLEIAKQGSLIPTSSLSDQKQPATLWGLPVVVSSEVPSGQAFMGDLRNVGLVACGCCGAVKNEAAKSPLCVCYIATEGTVPELCPDCEQCIHHHKDLPFGVCARPEIVQNVIRTRTRERARRKSEGAATK